MRTTCLNCHKVFDGKFCPNCGQKATVKRLTSKELLSDIVHFFTHLEKGFLFTTWYFLTKPGHASVEYLSGKRKQYQPSVSYFLIWTGLYIIFHNTIVDFFDYRMSGEVITMMDSTGQANRMLRQHFTLFILPAVFCSAVSFYFILAKPKFNFTETTALCLFGGGTYFMMLFFSDLVLGLIFRINVLSAPVFLWQEAISIFYNLWLAYDIFKRYQLRFFWLRILLAVSMVAVCGWVILFYLPIVWGYLSLKH